MHVYFFYAVLMVSVLAWFSVSAINTFAKLDAGVCLSENRVLTDEEHRQAFLRSVVRLEIKNSNIHDNLLGTQRLKTGIIHNAPVLEFRRLITEFYENERCFEENFSINVVAPRVIGFDVDKDLHEPFTLVNYIVSPAGSSTFTDARGVEMVKSSAHIERKYTPTLYERFQGFGNYYYNITYTFIDSDCCSERGRWESRGDYIKRKTRAYMGYIRSLERGFATHTTTAVASNCGDVLTESDDNGVGTKSIRWIASNRRKS